MTTYYLVNRKPQGLLKLLSPGLSILDFMVFPKMSSQTVSTETISSLIEGLLS